MTSDLEHDVREGGAATSDAQAIRGVGRVLACARRRDHGGGHALRLLS